MDSSTFDPGSYTTLKLDLNDGILTLTVDRPDALNALSQQVVSELWKAFTAIQDSCTHDAGWPVRGVIVTGGGGKAFVAGADIREMASMDPDSAAEYARSMQGVTLLIEKLPVPVIAAVDGFALGGGCELALACDFIYASEAAQFGQPEVNLGLVPGFGGSVRLPQRVGLGPARELIYTARRIDAAEALRLGLANRVRPSRSSSQPPGTPSGRSLGRLPPPSDSRSSPLPAPPADPPTRASKPRRRPSGRPSPPTTCARAPPPSSRSGRPRSPGSRERGQRAGSRVIQ